jgi:small subunit ribosomal protein S15
LRPFANRPAQWSKARGVLTSGAGVIRKYNLMSRTLENKGEIVKNFRIHETDTGSPEVQIALITKRIEHLAGHFKTHTKDHHSRRGLLKLVGRRRRLLDYLKRTSEERYRKVVADLELRK